LLVSGKDAKLTAIPVYTGANASGHSEKLVDLIWHNELEATVFEATNGQAVTYFQIQCSAKPCVLSANLDEVHVVSYCDTKTQFYSVAQLARE
jgi:hypothetical protein